MHPYLDASRFHAFAHRGGALEVPENSFEAFFHASDLGYRYFETDVQLTADGEVVVFHDDDMERLTGTRGLVSEKSWDEVRKLKVHGVGRIPLLNEVLEAFPKMKLNIDAKTDVVAGPLCKIGRAYMDRICFASDNDRRLQFMRDALGPDACTSSATGEMIRFALPALVGLKGTLPQGQCVQIPTHANFLPVLTKRMLNQAHEAGKVVHIWTIDDEGQMNRLIDFGVDGIMTDRPELLRQISEARGVWA